jgi:hypothetical protein
MKLSSPIEKDGLVEEILRICGTTNAIYSNYAMVTRINAGLDRYWQLASDAAPKGTFDDTNQTALPVETQNLVSGTNAYKISSFTNKVLQILKIAALNDDGLEEDLIREEFDNLDDFYELYSTDTGDQGTPQYWTKMGDYIYLRPCPSYSETSGLRAYANRELSKFTWVPFTVTVASPGVFTATAHGLSGLDGLIFETDGALPTGLTADTVVYYKITAGATADAFEVSTSYSLTGTAVNTSVSQSGNHKFLKVNKEPGIPVIHHSFLARYAALPFLIEKKLPQKNDIAQLINKDEQGILDYWQNRDRDLKTIITTQRRLFK